MSRTIDSRVVEMQFDNKQFEQNVATSMSTLDKLKRSLNMDGATKGLENVNDAAKNVNMSGLSGAVENVRLKFSALEVMAVTALVNITNSAINAGKRIVSALTIEPVSEGFTEYELKMGSIQTIMAGTGASLEQVNAKLEELNIYADKTIYSFGDMTSNIGKFTNAGVSLDESVAAIKGVANAAALSGSNTNEASRAMYNFAQALSAGHVKLIDWKSIELANMATVEFKTQLLESAVAAGTLSKTTDGMYKTLKGTVISATLGFNDSLQEQWMTTEALVKTLNDYADETTDIGKRATAAATEVKTLTQLFDTLKEAAGSGWAQTWELVIGGFEEAKETLTYLNDTIGGFIDRMSDARNELLSGALSSGWKQLMKHGISDSEDFKQTIAAVAKEHGISVDKMVEDAGSFEKSLKNGWLTSDILSESIEKLTEKFDGLSEEEIAQMGYTIENVEALKKLNSEVKDGSVSMEEFEEKIKSLSGREMIFESLFNIAKGIGSVLKPIGEAFRDIFPPTTSEQLHSFIVGLHEFSEKLKISDETADKIRRTFKGLFAVLDLIKDAFGFVLNVAGQVFSLFGGPTAGGILELTARFGDFLVKLHETAEAGNIFGRAFDKIQEVFTTVADKIKDAISRIGSAFQGFKSIDMGPLGEFSEDAEKSFRPFTRLGEIFGAAFEAIVKVLEWAAPIVAKLGSIVGKGLGALADKVSYAVDNMEFNEILDLINTGLFGAILIGIKKFIDSLTEITSGAGGFLDGITGILDGVRGSLEAYQNSLKAKTLLTIATAIGVLAASLVVLSMIPSDKLTTSLMGITVLFVELSAAMIVLSKTMGNVKMAKISGQMVAMATAILILSFAMNNLAELNWEGLAKGTLGIAALATTLVVSANMLDKSSGKLIKGSTGLIAFSTAILILTHAVDNLAQLSWGELSKGLVGLTVILTEVVTLTHLMGDPKRMISTGVGMIALGAAMLIFASAVEKMGQLSWGEIARGLTTMAGALTAITISLNFMPKGMINKATGMVVLGAALLIIADAMAKFGSMQWGEVARGLAAMAGALTAITVALNFMPKNMINKALGLIGVATALQIMIGPLKQMAGMSWGEIAKGLVTLGGALLIITVAMNAMTGGLAGAAAMLVMAAAIRVLTPALVSLGQMDLAEIGKALLALVGVFAVVGAAGLLLSPLTPAILALAAAIALLGVGVVAIGAGLLMFSAGLTALAVAGTAGAAALVVVVTSLISLIPMALEKLGKGIIAFAQVITNGLPVIMEAVRQIALGLIQVLVEITPPVVEALLTFLVTLLEQLTNAVPQMVDAGMRLLLGILEGIAAHIMDVVVVALNIISEFLRGIAEGIPGIISAGVDIVVAFLTAIGQETPRIIDAGFKMIIDFVNGLADAILENTPVLGEAMGNLAGAMIEGLIGGITSGIKRVVDSVKNLGESALNGLMSFLGINSPSKEFMYLGEAIGDGLTIGLNNSIVPVGEATSEMANEIIKMSKKSFKDFESWIADRKFFNDISIKEELLAWEKVQTRYKQGSEERKKADREVYRLQQELVKETYKYSMDWIADRKYYNELSLSEELAAYKRVQKRYMKGTEERKKADREVYRLENKIYDEKIRLEEEYYQKVKSINDKLKDDIRSLEDEYKNALDSRTKSLYDSYGLFDRADIRREASGVALIENLKSQVDAFEDWQENIDMLASRDVSSGMIKELQEMGPNATAQIKALNSLSDSELDEYVSLWSKKHKLAKNKAVDELQGLRKQTNNEIATLRRESEKELDDYRKMWNQQMDELTLNSERKISEIKTAFISSIGEIRVGTEDEFKALTTNSQSIITDAEWSEVGKTAILETNKGIQEASPKVINTFVQIISGSLTAIENKYTDFYNAGKYLVEGFADGITANTYLAEARARAMAAAAARAAERELGINSPSKVGYGIGSFFGKGFVNALIDYTSKSYQAGSEIAESAKSGLSNAISKIADVIEGDIDTQPTIRPVLDLSDVESGTGRLNALFSRTQAMSISARMSRVSGEEIQNGENKPVSGGTFSFVQNNYSPKSLSRIEIYRQTKNQISTMKGLVEA